MTAGIVLSAACLVGFAAADETRSKPPPTEVPVEVFKLDPAEVEVGSTTEISVTVRVAEGHRVQANPASNEFLVPVELEFEDASGLTFGDPVYPEPEPYRLQGAEQDLWTYHGQFEIVVPLSADESATLGERGISGELRFQACNSRMCLFPASLSVEVLLVVTPSGAKDGTQ